MTAIMKSDFFKLKKSRSLKVCMLVAFVLGLLMALLYHLAWNNLKDNMEMTRSMMMMFGSDEKTISDTLSIIPSDNLWSYVNTALCDTNVLYVAAIVISIFVGSEYSMGTVKNAVSRGCSHTGLFVSKLLFSMIIMLMTVVAYLAGVMIIGCILIGFGSEISAGQILLILTAYLAEFAAITGIYVMIAVWLKSTGHSIAFSLIMPMLISSVLQVAALVNSSNDLISHFWIFQTVTATQQLCLYNEGYIPFLVSAVYLVLSCLGGLLIFRRQELK